MALDFTALQTEFYARGLADLNDGGTGATRAKRWIVDAVHAIDDLEDWPYLTTTTTGTPPLTIADLGTIESVTTIGNQTTLAPADRRWLRDQYADLTTAGTPLFYYLTGGTTINVFPTNTSTTLTCDYWKVAPDLSAGADVPLMPDRYRMAIVHYAVAAAREDRGDFQGSASARSQGDLLVSQMMTKLLVLQHQGPQDYARAVGEDM